MLNDAAKALSQMVSPPLRAVLWKSIALALALITVIAVGLDWAIIWLVGALSVWVQSGLGSPAHLPVNAIAWLLSVAAALGIIAGSVLLMPAVTAFVAASLATRSPPRWSARLIRRIRPALPCRCRARFLRAAKQRCLPSWSIFVR